MAVKILVASAVLALAAPGAPALTSAHPATRHLARPYDVNGDGYTDLIAAAPGDTVNGVQGAGSVTVLFGGWGGVTTKGAQYLTQVSPGIAGDVASGGFSASSLASGDFNGDGYADVVIASEDGHTAQQVTLNALTLLPGSPKGLRARNSRRWRLPLLSNGLGDEIGPMVSADFNGDGYDDLVVGAPGATAAGAAGAGAILVFSGSRDGLVRNSMNVWSQASPGVPGQPDFHCFDEPDICDQPLYDAFGAALAAGDFDGNGYPDLAVGVPGESLGSDWKNPRGKHMVGAVEVFTGTTGGLRPTRQFWTQDSLARILHRARVDHGFGVSSPVRG